MPPGKRGAVKVKEIMVTEVFTATPGMDIERLLALFREKRITGVPVVDEDHGLVGIVSKDDVLFRRQRQTRESGPLDVEQLFKSGFAAVGGAPAQATKVAEVMTRDVVTAGPDEPIEEACRKMWDRRIHRLPVVKAGKIVGLLSVLDVCRAVADRKLPLP